ncbi:hypothetical protein BO82DRAFT_400450 [Aspergillus uvarum CBS 121591]|uniref:Swi5-dependent recombination DNA repair protein 1 n=1 Tax=Aspergillus uvarum CBS 121591 TaxID=1448315 RepID=A0A319CIT2_9EURO|nr:hypothetical protein BO82DRAFT_400450 [Aspergillus uvarum CBS 121591]PYH83701.1 hypothetical protein BO82DRAFT_400450 [Aspergillus uvarum CBS 121591]
MSSTHKRRRLNPSPSATLTKPFKSPLRRPAPATENPHEAVTGSPTLNTMQVQLQEQIQVRTAHTGYSIKPSIYSQNCSNNSVPSNWRRHSYHYNYRNLNLNSTPPKPGTYSPPPALANPGASSPNPDSTTPTPIKPSSQSRPRPRSRPLTLTAPRTPRTPQKPTPLSASSSPPTTELSALTTQKATLLAHLHALTAEHDTLQQARRIETQHKTVELERLIHKWKGISQRAAEEVFLGARERVSRMGGLQVLKAGAGSWGWDCEDQDPSAGLQGRGRSWEGDFGDGKGGQGQGHDDGDGEEQELTMEVMLKMMKIDFGVIGYDVEREGWGT